MIATKSGHDRAKTRDLATAHVPVQGLPSGARSTAIGPDPGDLDPCLGACLTWPSDQVTRHCPDLIRPALECPTRQGRLTDFAFGALSGRHGSPARPSPLIAARSPTSSRTACASARRTTVPRPLGSKVEALRPNRHQKSELVRVRLGLGTIESAVVHDPRPCLRAVCLPVLALVLSCAQGPTRDPLVVPPGPTDLRATLFSPPDSITSLRGLVQGDSVILTCDCLERSLLVGTKRGRFSIDGLPPGTYTAHVQRPSGQDSCHGTLDPAGRTVLLQGHILANEQRYPETRSPFDAAGPASAAPVPCEFVRLFQTDGGEYQHSIDALWDEAMP